MHLLITFGGFLIFIFGVVYLSDKFKPATLSSSSLNSPPFALLLLGAALTAICQSSSATGIIALLLLDKDALRLKQAAFFLIGGNVGSTFSGQLFSFSMGNFITLLIFFSVILGVLQRKKPRLTPLFNIFVSFSCIFFGLDILKTAAHYYSPVLIELLQVIETKFSALIFGCFTTAIFQSSSLVIGILIIFVEKNILALNKAIMAAFGLNIGTCSTLVVVSTGLGTGGKRGAFFHLIFNIMGVIMFTLVLPYFTLMVERTAGDPARALANAHTFFNLLTALVFLPFWGCFEKIIYFVYPASK